MLNVNNNFDNVFIGGHFLSYLLTLTQKNKKLEKFLFIENKNYKIPEYWLRHISEIERIFLTEYGKRNGIKVLANLDQYISKMEMIVNIESKMFHFSHDPYNNLQEILRKYNLSSEITEFFVHHIDKEKFNADCFKLFETIASFFINADHNDNFNFFFENIFKGLIYENFFHLFFKELTKEIVEGEVLKYLLFSNQLIFQTCMHNFYFKFELLFIFLRIFSPVYKLDKEKIDKDLETLFIDRGGSVKYTNFSEIQIFKKKAINCLLDSFDGRIDFKNIFFNSIDYSHESQNVFMNLRVELSLTGTNIPTHWSYIDIKPEYISKLYNPCTFFNFYPENKVVADIVIEKTEVISLKKYHQLIKEKIKNKVKDIFGDVLDDQFDIIIKEGHETWRYKDIYSSSVKSINSELKSKKGLNIEYEEEGKIQNIYDFGPWFDNLFGIMTYLVKMQLIFKDEPPYSK